MISSGYVWYCFQGRLSIAPLKSRCETQKRWHVLKNSLFFTFELKKLHQNGSDCFKSVPVSISLGSVRGSTKICGSREILPRFCPLFSSLPLFHSGSKQPWIETQVLGHSLVRLLAPLSYSLAPPCLLRSRAPLCSLVLSLTHFTHSRESGWLDDYSVLFFYFGP